MKKITTLLLILSFLFGCQNQSTLNENYLKQDAKEVYLIIKNKYLDTSYLSDYEQKKTEEFQDTYVGNYKDYKDQQLISDIEGLINCYNLYYVSIGMKNTDGEKMYKEQIEKLIKTLDKKFNN